MLQLVRISKFSTMAIMKSSNKTLDEIFSDKKIIQLMADENYVAVEYVELDSINQYIAEQTGPLPKDEITPMKSREQKELETALDTVLNNDPLGRYNGCNLRVPFDKGDAQWVEWVLENMHNKFIKDKVKLIKESGYGQ